MSYKLTEKQAFDLLWNVVIGEDQENFVPEYRKDVLEVLRKVRELEAD